jgi:Common central domain of tyrosinase/Polyphenol oxidase middle domain
MISKRIQKTLAILIATVGFPFLQTSFVDGQEVSPTAGSTAAPQMRMKWQDFISGVDGAKRLGSLQAAVAKMKSLDKSPHESADYRRSWEYWANIHGYYGAKSPDGTVAEQLAYLTSIGLGSLSPYYNGITDQTAPDAIAEKIWATCEHSGNTQALNFFGWHRMYLYYFERVLRWAAGDNTLRLPYWDYTDPNQELLPTEFRDKTSALYDSRRDPGLNTGTSKLNSNSTNPDSFLQNPDYFSFESAIENRIHGYVHCTVGPRCPVAYMGDVPVAANDPVFYSHHANIDRLWDCWQNAHSLPAGTWQDQQFSFVDETGALQSQPVKNFLKSAPLGYVYDNVASCPRAGAAHISANVAVEQATAEGKQLQKTTLATSNHIAIDHPQTTVDISVSVPNARILATPPEGTVSTELVLRDVTAESQPGVLFDVYIAKKNQPEARKFVGTISWFGAFRHHGSKGPEKRTFEFLVSDQLRELGEIVGTSLTVTVEATEGRVPTNPDQIKSFQAEAAKAFRPQAKVQIGAIELQTKSLPGPANEP